MTRTIVTKIYTPTPFKIDPFIGALMDAVQATVKEADREFAKTYAEFKGGKPRFKQKFRKSRKRLEGETRTNDPVYYMLDRGAKPHRIPRSGKANLKFRYDGKGSYKAATKPGVIGSQRSQYPTTWVRRDWVNHPGHKPRKFEKTIAKLELPRFKRRVVNVLPRAAKVSGHAM